MGHAWGTIARLLGRSDLTVRNFFYTRKRLRAKNSLRAVGVIVDAGGAREFREVPAHNVDISDVSLGHFPAPAGAGRSMFDSAYAPKKIAYGRDRSKWSNR
jgi:hypothetical protein